MNFLILTLLVTLVSAYSPFMVKPLTTHQPVGNNEGQTNYYQIAFNVSSSNGIAGAVSSSSCSASWGDNSYLQSQAYSLDVPTGYWIGCDNSEFSFQLFEYFSIGNFTLAIQQNFTAEITEGTPQQILALGSTHVTNTTSQYTCQIIASEVMYIQHAHGDCSIPSTASAIKIPVTSITAAPAPCLAGSLINTTFLTTAQTTPGQSILVVGSIPQLGNWNPIAAVPMWSSNNGGKVTAPTWSTSLEIAAGTYFEWKYLLRELNGSETWECCENRVFTVPSGSCSTVPGNDPDTFRSGGYHVAGT